MRNLSILPDFLLKPDETNSGYVYERCTTNAGYK